MGDKYPGHESACASFGRHVGEQHAPPDSRGTPSKEGQCADREAAQAVLCGSQLSQLNELFVGHRHNHTPQAAIHGDHYKDLWIYVDTGKKPFSAQSCQASTPPIRPTF